MSGMASDGEFWITKVQSIIHSLEENAKHLKPLARSDGEDIVIQKARDMVLRLQQVRGVNNERLILDRVCRMSRGL